MVQSALRDVVIVGFAIQVQRAFQLIRRCETGLFDEFADAAIEALDHPIGLWVSGGVKGGARCSAWRTFGQRHAYRSVLFSGW